VHRRAAGALVAAAWLALVMLAAVAQTATTDLKITQTSGPQRVALVVGMSRYQHIPALDNPANDARLMADTLGRLGFVLVGGGAQLDLDKAGFDRAVQQFGQQIIGAQVALFYYAGHGLQVAGTNWLVPTDANPTREIDLDFQMLDANLVLRQMEGAGTKLNLLILDACRNNPFGGRGLRATTGGLAQMKAPEGTLISYATQPGNVAIDGADGDSPFTKALAHTLMRPGLDVFKLFNEVGLQVKLATAGMQQPWVSNSPIDGDFYFLQVPAGAIVTVRPPGTEAAAPPADREALLWSSVKDRGNLALLQTYLDQFPQGVFADAAKVMIEDLKRKEVAAASPTESALRDTTWRALCAGCGTEALHKFFIRLRSDGDIGIAYTAPADFKFQPAGVSTWHLEGDELVLSWTDGYSIDRYSFDPTKTKARGVKTNVRGPVFIEKLP
jgi:hypothetical protein